MRNRRMHRKAATKPRRFTGLIRLIVLSLLVAFSLLMFVSFKVSTLDKFVYLNKLSDGGAEIVILDSQNDKVTKLLIPGDLMLDSARGYGNYKVSNLWKLSEKEEADGNLMSETILKNFLIPVPLWKNGSESNTTLYQRIKIYLVEKKDLDYSATITSSSKKLSDTILINFVDPNFSENTPKVDITDLTGDIQTATKVSKVVEIIGGKIASNSKGYEKDLDCEVYGKNQKSVEVFADVFNCTTKVDTNEPLDIKIRLGGKFAERF